MNACLPSCMYSTQFLHSYTVQDCMPKEWHCSQLPVIPTSNNLIKIILRRQTQKPVQSRQSFNEMSSHVMLTYVKLTINANHYITSLSTPVVCSSLNFAFPRNLHCCLGVSKGTPHILPSASSCQSPALLKPSIGLPGLLELFLGI